MCLFFMSRWCCCWTLHKDLVSWSMYAISLFLNKVKFAKSLRWLMVLQKCNQITKQIGCKTICFCAFQPCVRDRCPSLYSSKHTLWVPLWLHVFLQHKNCNQLTLTQQHIPKKNQHVNLYINSHWKNYLWSSIFLQGSKSLEKSRTPPWGPRPLFHQLFVWRCKELSPMISACRPVMRAFRKGLQREVSNGKRRQERK